MHQKSVRGGTRDEKSQQTKAGPLGRDRGHPGRSHRSERRARGFRGPVRTVLKYQEKMFKHREIKTTPAESLGKVRHGPPNAKRKNQAGGTPHQR